MWKQMIIMTVAVLSTFHNIRHTLALTLGRQQSCLSIITNHRRVTQLQSKKSSTTSSSTSSLTSQPLKTLEGNNIYAAEEVIKKSRFIGYATHCTSWDEAQDIIEGTRKDHPKSRHVCFGFVSSSSNDSAGTERASDDGEPTGTAGAPILNSIKGKELSDVLCIVVRYSGGIKLGAGGLIRAYGGTASLVLQSSPTQVHIPQCTIRISTNASNSGSIYTAAAKHGGVTSNEMYNEKGDLEVTITCDEVNGDTLKDAINDATRGGVVFLSE